MGKVKFLFLVIIVISCPRAYSQLSFDLCPTHHFRQIDKELHDAVENDFVTNGRTSPTISWVDSNSITITNPFLDEIDLFETYNRYDTTSVTSRKVIVKAKEVLSQLNLPYVHKQSVLKQLNFYGRYCYLLYLSDSSAANLIQWDSNTHSAKVCAVFNNTLDLSYYRNDVKIFFGGSEIIAISNLKSGENVVIGMKGDNFVSYCRTPKSLTTVGVLAKEIIAVDETKGKIYKINCVDRAIDEIVLTKPPKFHDRLFFFDYVTSELYVYFFDFKTFCLQIKRIAIK